MTIVAAFPAHTFAEAPFDIFAWVPLDGLHRRGSLARSASILAFVFRFTVLRGAAGPASSSRSTSRPEDISALLAANLVDKPKKGMAAAIVDLAVRRKIRIVEKPAEGLLRQRHDVRRPAASTRAGCPATTSASMTALFATSGIGFLRNLLGARRRRRTPGIITIGQPTTATQAATAPDGEVRWLVKKDQILGQQVVSITKAVAAEAVSRKLRRKPPGLPIAHRRPPRRRPDSSLLLLGGIGAQSELGIVAGVFGTIAASWIGVGALIMLGGRRPLTKEGALAKEHLEGLREYIRLAEADRLQMLQSVSGAERTEDRRSARHHQDLRAAAAVRGASSASRRSGRASSASTTTPTRRTGTRART